MRDIKKHFISFFAASTQTPGPGAEETNHSPSETPLQAQPTNLGEMNIDGTRADALPHDSEPEGVSTFKLTEGAEKPTLDTDLATTLDDSFKAADTDHDEQSEHVNQDCSESLPGTHNPVASGDGDSFTLYFIETA